MGSSSSSGYSITGGYGCVVVVVVVLTAAAVKAETGIGITGIFLLECFLYVCMYIGREILVSPPTTKKFIQEKEEEKRRKEK